MNSRERVALALAHKQPDRTPIDLGSNGQTGMNVSTLYRFRRELGLPEHPIKVIEPAQMLGEIEDDAEDFKDDFAEMGVDCLN